MNLKNLIPLTIKKPVRQFVNYAHYQFNSRTGRLENVLDDHITSAPSPQNALDIFKGEWASLLPEPYAGLKAGIHPLFEDPRIVWSAEEAGGFQSKTFLDLGPLEGGHPYMFERAGAESVVSIESNARAYQKCLITKELFGLKRVRYLYGDFMEYLRSNREKFDIVNASGVLYHQRNPIELLARVAEAANCILIWTHYYDHAVVSKDRPLFARFSPGKPSEYAGFRHTLYRSEYGRALHRPGFCGGNSAFANWLAREDIIGCLKQFGLGDVRIGFEKPLHPHGPSFCLVAMRR